VAVQLAAPARHALDASMNVALPVEDVKTAFQPSDTAVPFW
jgi:hypothetical protein